MSRDTGVTGDLVVTGSLTVPAADLSWRFSRSGGPGGQGVNTADSRVELSVDVLRCSAFSELHRARLQARLGSRLIDGVLTVAASEHREQRRNRDAARTRLAAALREGIAPPGPPRRPTAPSRSARRRRVDGKTARGRTKSLRRKPGSHD